MDIGNLISGSSAFSKSSLNIWKFTVHVLLKPGLENFEHYYISMWDESNCEVVWAFFGIAFLWDSDSKSVCLQCKRPGFYLWVWKIPWRRKWQPIPVLLPGKSHGQSGQVGCRPWGCWELDMTEQLPFHFSLSCIGEGNGNPLQYSCLENHRDGGAWWAAVYGVTQNLTWLKWLGSSSSSSSTC